MEVLKIQMNCMTSKAVKSIFDNKAKSGIETMLQQHEEVFKGIGIINFQQEKHGGFFGKIFHETRRYTSCTETSTCSLVLSRTSEKMA